MREKMHICEKCEKESCGVSTNCSKRETKHIKIVPKRSNMQKRGTDLITNNQFTRYNKIKFKQRRFKKHSLM